MYFCLKFLSINRDIQTPRKVSCMYVLKPFLDVLVTMDLLTISRDSPITVGLSVTHRTHCLSFDLDHRITVIHLHTLHQLCSL